MSVCEVKQITNINTKRDSNMKQKLMSNTSQTDSNNNRKHVSFDLSSIEEELERINNDNQNQNDNHLIEIAKQTDSEKQSKRMVKRREENMEKLSIDVSNAKPNRKSESFGKTNKKSNERIDSDKAKPLDSANKHSKLIGNHKNNSELIANSKKKSNEEIVMKSDKSKLLDSTNKHSKAIGNHNKNSELTAKTNNKLNEEIVMKSDKTKPLESANKPKPKHPKPKHPKPIANLNNNSELTANSKKISNEDIVKDKAKQLDQKLDNKILWDLFVDLDKKYFDGYLASKNLIIKWTNKMFIAAGVTLDDPVEIRISAKLHKLLPHKDLVETLLHEMIHAYHMFKNVNENHGPQFLSLMKKINTIGKFNITVGHSFKAEVEKYKEERRLKKLEKAEEMMRNLNIGSA